MRRILSLGGRAPVLACVLAVAAALGGGCGRPSVEECGKAVDHLLELIEQAGPPESDDVKKVLEQNFQEKKQKYVQECKEQGTKKDVDCLLGAKTLDDLQKNCGGSFATK